MIPFPWGARISRGKRECVEKRERGGNPEKEGFAPRTDAREQIVGTGVW